MAAPNDEPPVLTLPARRPDAGGGAGPPLDELRRALVDDLLGRRDVVVGPSMVVARGVGFFARRVELGEDTTITAVQEFALVRPRSLRPAAVLPARAASEVRRREWGRARPLPGARGLLLVDLVAPLDPDELVVLRRIVDVAHAWTRRGALVAPVRARVPVLAR